MHHSTLGIYALSPILTLGLCLPLHADEPPPKRQEDAREEPEHHQGDTQKADAHADAHTQALMDSLKADAEASTATASGSESGYGGNSNPDMAFILDFAGAYINDEDPMQTGAHDPNATGFVLQQLELSLGANVDPLFRFDANLVFSSFGVEVEEAYGSTLALPGNLKARAGQFLTVFGRLNATHPHTWSFVDQPLVNGKFLGGEGSRGPGLELSWLSPLPWYVEVTGSATSAAGECCARSFYGSNDLGIDGVDDLLYTTALKQFFEFSESVGLLLGTSAQFGPNPTGQGNRTELYGLDLYLRFRPESTDRSSLSLQAEVMARKRQLPNALLSDYGGYTQMIWAINPSWSLGGRYERVTGLKDDPLDPEWISARSRYSVQMTHNPSHFSRIRLQGAMDDPEWREEPIASLFLALELVVGAHAAHNY